MFKSNTIENNLPIIIKLFDFSMPDAADNNIWSNEDQDQDNLVNIFKQIANGYKHQRPIVIYDYNNDYTWYSGYLEQGTYDEEYRAIFIHISKANQIGFCDMSFIYDTDTKKVTVNCNAAAAEELMSTDNVKTLFGNQSIVGSGNIDLFNHFITLTLSDNSKLYLNYYSSNKLVCDSIQDLTTVTKAVANTKIAVGNTYINYTGSVWQTANSVNITAVADVVTTI